MKREQEESGVKGARNSTSRPDRGAPAPTRSSSVMNLQRSAGNRAVTSRLSAPSPTPVQRIGQGDKDEDLVKLLSRSQDLKGIGLEDVAEILAKLIKNAGTGSGTATRGGSDTGKTGRTSGSGFTSKIRTTKLDASAVGDFSGKSQQDLQNELRELKKLKGLDNTSNETSPTEPGDLESVKAELRKLRAEQQYEKILAGRKESKADEAVVAEYQKKLEEADTAEKRQETLKEINGYQTRMGVRPTSEDAFSKLSDSEADALRSDLKKRDGLLKEINDLEKELILTPTTAERFRIMSNTRAEGRLAYLKKKRQEFVEFRQHSEEQKANFNEDTKAEFLENEAVRNNPLFASWGAMEKRSKQSARYTKYMKKQSRLAAKKR